MAIYTGVADANGDFTVPFSSSYTSGQKVTVTAEKDGAEKSIELFAPSEVVGQSEGFLFGGSMVDFPLNITSLTIVASGVIQNGALQASLGNFVTKITGLTIGGNVTSIGSYAFNPASKIAFLNLPDSLVAIGVSAFAGAVALLEINIPVSVATLAGSAFSGATACKKVTIGSSVESIGSNCFYNLKECDEFIVNRSTPPNAGAGFLQNLKSTCIIKVPTASLTAYQTAPNWSAFASQMIGV